VELPVSFELLYWFLSTLGLAITGLRISQANGVSNEQRKAPLFSCHDKLAHIYTHARIEHLIFHLGRDIFQRGSSGGGVHQSLTVHAALRWNMLMKPGPVAKEVRKVTLKVKKP
jgi:hypothetical protein